MGIKLYEYLFFHFGVFEESAQSLGFFNELTKVLESHSLLVFGYIVEGLVYRTEISGKNEPYLLFGVNHPLQRIVPLKSGGNGFLHVTAVLQNTLKI